MLRTASQPALIVDIARVLFVWVCSDSDCRAVSGVPRELSAATGHEINRATSIDTVGAPQPADKQMQSGPRFTTNHGPPARKERLSTLPKLTESGGGPAPGDPQVFDFTSTQRCISATLLPSRARRLRAAPSHPAPVGLAGWWRGCADADRPRAPLLQFRRTSQSGARSYPIAEATPCGRERPQAHR